MRLARVDHRAFPSSAVLPIPPLDICSSTMQGVKRRFVGLLILRIDIQFNAENWPFGKTQVKVKPGFPLLKSTNCQAMSWCPT